MADAVTVPYTPPEEPLAPGQTMPDDAPDAATLDPTVPVAAEPAEGAEVPEKFKNEDGSVNTEALLKSYSELERARQTRAEDAPGAEPKPGDAEEGDPKPDADDAYKDVTYGSAIDNVLNAAELAPADVAREYAETGALSDDTYTALEKAGFSRPVVEQYVKGAEASATQSAANAKTLMDGAGGEEQYGQMTKWAATALTPDEIRAFDATIDSGDMAQAALAITGLKAKYEQANGTSPGSLNFGGGKPSLDVFSSAEEASDALHAAQKSGDPGRIKAAEDKAMRSDVFG